MPDPMQRMSNSSASSPSSAVNNPAPLFGTQFAAHATSSRTLSTRHAQILHLLQTVGPLTMPEICQRLGVLPNQISGRFTELTQSGQIIATTQTRPSPTGCPSTIYRLPDPSDQQPLPDLGESIGYPDTLILGQEGTFERQPTCESETWPGLAYSRRGPVRLTYRFRLITCPLCGTPLRQVATQPRKQYRCGGATCNHTWESALVHTPGGPDLIALVMRTLDK